MRVARTCRLALCTTLTLLAPALVAVETAQAAETPSCSSFSWDVQQLVKPSSNANLLTRWNTEATIAEQQYGFSDNRGVLAEVAGSDGAGLTAIWRLYKPGDFTWAAAGNDVDALVAQGYIRQFVDFYAATEQTDCLNPIYRLTKGSVHRMANAADSAGLVNAGWTRDTVAFYAKTDVAPAPNPDPAPDPDPAPAPDPGSDTDTRFSIAVLPDTQNEMTNLTDTRFSNRAAWLVANKQALDLRYAMQIGDLTNWGEAVPSQFTKASNEFKPLEAAMPWAGAIGNHDTKAVCVGGSACPGQNTNLAVRNTEGYNAAFPTSRFPRLGGTYEAGKIDNSYQTFRAGGVNWLVLSLELWPRAGAVNWAKTVVASHPDHNVIVVTHAYLDPDGSISGSNGGYGATSPQYLYDNLIKQYSNIKVVLSGHVGNSAIRTDTGINGNKIVSMLQCYHSWTNPVRLVEIDTAAGSVTSKVYAPAANLDFSGDATSTGGMTFVK